MLPSARTSAWLAGAALLATTAYYCHSLRRRFRASVWAKVQQLRAEAEQAASNAPPSPLTSHTKPKSPKKGKGKAKGGAAPEMPRCVQLYLDRALRDAPETARLYTITHQGHMRFAPDAAWKELSSVNYSTPLTPAFLWTGTMQFAPLLPAEGYDGRIAGRGMLHWRLLGCLPVATADQPELSQATLARYLAEGVLAPHALRPRPGLRWEAVEGADNEAVAVLTDGAHTVRCNFYFNDNDEVERVASEDYLRLMPDGSIQRWPWRCRCSDYQPLPCTGAQQAGTTGSSSGSSSSVWVPTHCEVGWVEPSGAEFCYIKLQVCSVAVE